MAAAKPKDITACPDWGKGGSYTIDPATGIRTLVQRTEDAPAIAPAAPPAAAPADTPPAAQPVKKES